jgi:hypothetical protein
MTSDGRAGCTRDRRGYALILPATFAGPHGGEATRSDVVISTWTRTSGCGPPTRTDRPGECPRPAQVQARPAYRGMPDAIMAAPREHLPVFVKDDYGARPAGGQPALRRSARRHQISPFRAPEAATAAIKIVVDSPERQLRARRPQPVLLTASDSSRFDT